MTDSIAYNAGMDPSDVAVCDVCLNQHHEEALEPIPGHDEVICPACLAEMRAEMAGEVAA